MVVYGQKYHIVKNYHTVTVFLKLHYYIDYSMDIMKPLNEMASLQIGSKLMMRTDLP